MWPAGGVDFRPAGLLMVVMFSALALVLWRLRPESRDIGLWMGSCSCLRFFSLLRVDAQRQPERHRPARSAASSSHATSWRTLAAISGAVGITVVSALAGYDTLRRLASVGTCAGLIYFSLTAAQII